MRKNAVFLLSFIVLLQFIKGESQSQDIQTVASLTTASKITVEECTSDKLTFTFDKTNEDVTEISGSIAVTLKTDGQTISASCTFSATFTCVANQEGAFAKGKEVILIKGNYDNGEESAKVQITVEGDDASEGIEIDDSSCPQGKNEDINILTSLSSLTACANQGKFSFKIPKTETASFTSELSFPVEIVAEVTKSEAKSYVKLETTCSIKDSEASELTCEDATLTDEITGGDEVSYYLKDGIKTEDGSFVIELKDTISFAESSAESDAKASGIKFDIKCEEDPKLSLELNEAPQEYLAGQKLNERDDNYKRFVSMTEIESLPSDNITSTCKNETISFTIGNLKEANEKTNLTFDLVLLTPSTKANCNVTKNKTEIICEVNSTGLNITYGYNISFETQNVEVAEDEENEYKIKGNSFTTSSECPLNVNESNLDDVSIEKFGSITRPKIVNKKINFLARVFMKGNFTGYEQKSIGSLFFPIVIILEKTSALRRLASEEVNIRCANSESVSDKKDEDDVEFECNSLEEKTKGDLEGASIKIKSVNGNEENRDLGKISDLPNKLDNVSTLTLSAISCKKDDKLHFSGSGSVADKDEVDIDFTSPKQEAIKCTVTSNELICPLKAEDGEASGFKFDNFYYSENNLDYIISTEGIAVQEGDIEECSEESSRIFGSKKSSRLSTGAIVGIIVGCAAALFAGILAAILCKKNAAESNVAQSSYPSTEAGIKSAYY